MFGAPVKTFSGNKLGLLLLVLLSLIALAVTVSVYTEADPSSKIWVVGSGIAVLAPLALIMAWIRSIRLTLFQEGFTYQSLFGTCEMRWSDVDRIYYQAVRQSVNFIPVGTSRTIKVIDRSGKKFKIGNRVANSEQLASDLVSITHDSIFDRAAATYNSGSEVDFGAVRLSRTAGLRVKGLFGYTTVPLSDVHSYKLHQGSFHLWRKQKRFSKSVSIAAIANVFVLTSILDALYQRTATTAG
jgi:hypothetical protein